MCNVRPKVVAKAAEKDSFRAGMAAAAVAAALLMGFSAEPAQAFMHKDRETPQGDYGRSRPVAKTLDNFVKVNDEPDGVTGGVDKAMYNYVKSPQDEPKLPKVSDSEALLDQARDTVEQATKRAGAILDYPSERAD